MRSTPRTILLSYVFLSVALQLALAACAAQNASFHNAPSAAKEMKNPYVSEAAKGAASYHARCANCHGEKAEGMGNIPALDSGSTQSATDGELFWYITKGDVGNGMP